MPKSRAHSSIETLGVQELVGHLLEIPGTTYEQIVEQVKATTGKRITKSALSRYRASWADAQKQLELARQDAEAITAMLKQNPELNFTESAMAMLLGKLVRRFAHAQESFEAVPLDKLSHLLVKVARAQQYTEVIRQQGERLALLQQHVRATADKVKTEMQAAGVPREKIVEMVDQILGVAP